MRGAHRVGAVALAALAWAGCNTKGENLPLTVAKYQPPKVLSEEEVRIAPEPMVPMRPVRVAERAWLPTATEYRLPARFVRPVGAADGTTFYALGWDDPPYDRLLARAEPRRPRDAGAFPTRPDTWRELLEVY